MLQFGSTTQFSLARTRPWLTLGPGWAMLAGAATQAGELNLPWLLQLAGLWLLVDPILGTLWELAVTKGLWRTIVTADLPAPTRYGFYLPYAQPKSPGARLSVLIRRYQKWWHTVYWPAQGDQVVTFGLGAGLALGLSLLFGLTIFQLSLLCLGLILLAGQYPTDLTDPAGGRLQSMVQFLLPWAMGAALIGPLTPLALLPALCFWVTYLGALRMLGRHHRADWLFWLGQITGLLVLLAQRALLGAAMVAVLLLAQFLIRRKVEEPAQFLSQVQLQVIVAAVVVGFSLGSG